MVSRGPDTETTFALMENMISRLSNNEEISEEHFGLKLVQTTACLPAP